MWGGLGVPVWGDAAGRCSVETLTNVDISPVYKCRLLQLENTQIVLGEIQRCSKRKCRRLGLTNAKRPSQQIQISAVSK